MSKYIILIIGRQKRREKEKNWESKLIDADIDPRYVTVSPQFLPSAAPLSILDPCSLPYYPALINLLEKRAFSNGAAVRRRSALSFRQIPQFPRTFTSFCGRENFAIPSRSTISPQRNTSTISFEASRIPPAAFHKRFEERFIVSVSTDRAKPRVANRRFYSVSLIIFAPESIW